VLQTIAQQTVKHWISFLPVLKPTNTNIHRSNANRKNAQNNAISHRNAATEGSDGLLPTMFYGRRILVTVL
jgi:hypothetical protein